MRMCRACMKRGLRQEKMQSLSHDDFTACSGFEGNILLPRKLCRKCYKICKIIMKFQAQCAVTEVLFEKWYGQKTWSIFQYDRSRPVEANRVKDEFFEVIELAKLNGNVKQSCDQQRIEVIKIENVETSPEVHAKEFSKSIKHEIILNAIPYEVDSSDDGFNDNRIDENVEETSDIFMEVEALDENFELQSCLYENLSQPKVVFSMQANNCFQDADLTDTEHLDDIEDGREEENVEHANSNKSSCAMESETEDHLDESQEWPSAKVEAVEEFILKTIDTLETEDTDTDLNPCPECGALLLPDEFAKHTKCWPSSKELSDYLICPKCPYSTDNRCSMFKHKESDCAPSFESGALCIICGSFYENIRDHELTHLIEKCPICYAMVLKTNIKDHIKSHKMPERTYLCDICNENIPIAKKKLHMDKHHHLKKSSICERRDNLNGFTDLHSARYMCRYCGAVMSQNDHATHERLCKDSTPPVFVNNDDINGGF